MAKNNNYLTISVYGEEVKVQITAGEYPFLGNPYFGFVAYDEDCGCMMPYCDITSNTEMYMSQSPYHALVKNYSENSFMPAVLEATGLAKPTGVTIPSGFVRMPEYLFDEDMVKKYLYTGEDGEGGEE